MASAANLPGDVREEHRRGESLRAGAMEEEKEEDAIDTATLSVIALTLAYARAPVAYFARVCNATTLGGNLTRQILLP